MDYPHISGEIEVIVLHKFDPIILLQVNLKMDICNMSQIIISED